MVKDKTRMQRLSGFLAGAALIMFLVMMAALMLSAHVVTVHEGFENYPMNELVVFWWDNPILSIGATAAAVAVCMGLHALLEKGRRLHLEKLLFALWIAVSVFWVWGAGVVPRADSERVVNAALLFAADDYSALHMQYFHDYSFQLGFCLPLEIIARVFPALDLALMMQVMNVLMCVLMIKAMGGLAQELTGDIRREAVKTLYLLFLPMPFYCTYVYGTIPMMCFTALSFLYFARFVRRGRQKDGWLFMLCMGIAVMLKPNAMVPLIAFCIVVVLLSMGTRSVQMLLYAAGAAVLSLGLPRLVVAYYEMRAGVDLCEDISMLSRLVIGLQLSATGAGWFNNYTERFSPYVMEPQMARVLLLADLRRLFEAFAQAPATFVQFMTEKCASLWLEPTYSALWHGAVADVAGRFNGLANMVYLGALRLPVERIMDAFQQAMYVLACIGAGSIMKKRHDPIQILLPVTVLGGFFYHAIFEAKSQYIFVYAFFLMPVAAQGLCVLERRLSALCKRIKKK